MTTLRLLPGQTAVIDAGCAVVGDVYDHVELGCRSTIVLDGVHVVFNSVSLTRLGPRTVELQNGAKLSVVNKDFASLGASIVYRIGAGCTFALDANFCEPEIIDSTSIEFASEGSGTFHFVPAPNPAWRNCPQVSGWQEGDIVELAGPAAAWYSVDGGQLLPKTAAPAIAAATPTPGAAAGQQGSWQDNGAGFGQGRQGREDTWRTGSRRPGFRLI